MRKDREKNGNEITIERTKMIIRTIRSDEEKNLEQIKQKRTKIKSHRTNNQKKVFKEKIP